MISDLNHSTCGFGVGLIQVDVITMTQQQVDTFKEAMGLAIDNHFTKTIFFANAIKH